MSVVSCVFHQQPFDRGLVWVVSSAGSFGSHVIWTTILSYLPCFICTGKPRHNSTPVCIVLTTSVVSVRGPLSVSTMVIHLHVPLWASSVQDPVIELNIDGTGMEEFYFDTSALKGNRSTGLMQVWSKWSRKSWDYCLLSCYWPCTVRSSQVWSVM